MRIIINSLRGIKIRFVLLIRFLFNYKKYIDCESFYPEKEHKSKHQIFWDFVLHIIKYGELDESYFALGIDVKGVNYDDYLTYSQYIDRICRLNRKKPLNYICLLRDKTLFSAVGKVWGVPVIKELARFSGGRMVESEYSSIQDLIKEYNHLFIKPVDGQKGEDIFSLDYKDGELMSNGKLIQIDVFVNNIQQLSNQKDFIVQEKIQQHPLVSALHKSSVNTLRVVTINHLHSPNPDDVILVGSELRVGCGNSCTDNISAGGIKIEVDNKGKLCKYGYYRMPHGTKTVKHPDSGIVFENYSLPYYSEIIELCKGFHAKLKGIHLIGWDVAITDKGPVFIEGNDTCGTDFQVMRGPMKDFYNKYLPAK